MFSVNQSLQNRTLSEMLKDVVLVEWMKEDDLTLVEQIQKVVPVNDTQTYSKRLALVDFEEASSNFFIIMFFYHT
jgi:hypothetical protein